MKLLKTQNSILNAEVNTLETKLPDENAIIHTYLQLFWIQNCEVENKMQNSISLVNTTILNRKNSEV